MKKKKLKKYIGKSWFTDKRPFEEFDAYEIYYWQLANQIYVKLTNSIPNEYRTYVSKKDIKNIYNIEKEFVINYLYAESLPSNFILYLMKRYDLNNLKIFCGLLGNNSDFLYFLRSLKPHDFFDQFPHISIVET